MSIRIKQNGQWVEVQSSYNLDNSLSIEGKAADAKAVGDRFDKLPIATFEADTGAEYTEILGMRRPTEISFEKEESTITIITKLNDETIYTTVYLDANGYPTSIDTNGIECKLSWEGF